MINIAKTNCYILYPDFNAVLISCFYLNIYNLNVLIQINTSMIIITLQPTLSFIDKALITLNVLDPHYFEMKQAYI